MKRFVLPAAVSVLAGALVGAAAVFGITLVAQGETEPTLTEGYEPSSVSNQVEYGDRCFHGHCLPCNSKQSCENFIRPYLPEIPSLP
jgi:hypothetical protein